MNDDGAASTSAQAQHESRPRPDGTEAGSGSGSVSDRTGSEADGLDVDETARSGAELRTQKRLELLEQLTRSLDLLLYCEFSILYYMDCSFVRFFFRCVIQLYYLTPKPAYLPAMPQPAPYIGAIVGSNVLAMLLHLLRARAVASEASRGYLHGGLLIDFVGQGGPSSKVHMVALDLLILGLQVTMLSVVMLCRELRGELSSAATAESDEASASPVQDHDAEERGERRGRGTEGEAMELHPFSSAEIGVAGGGGEDGAAEAAGTTDEHALDGFYSGESVVAELHVIDTIRAQWRAYEEGGRRQGRSADRPSSAVAAASWAGGRLGIRIRIGGRHLG